MTNPATPDKLIVVEGFTPSVGDGLLFVGDSWKRIAPSMEAYAIDRLMRENKRLQEENERLIISGVDLLRAAGVDKPNKDSDA